ncbi:carbohydrate ABC transporter permease [Lacticaseibacillus parakribbianus]|uniref:carbohydrate ABC transporter permease n=1 Tax=Lacticaseibacillus parakribbianus TaxID=2970927 RepID=UPI0021CB356D|nr:carbohydrate ABC transporter permease [Lacticaseibacillus parakribbianus]
MTEKLHKYFARSSKGDVVLDIVKWVVLALVLLVTLYPFWNVLIVSFNDATDAVRGGIYWWPRKFSLASYTNILQNVEFLDSIKVTVARTLIGTPVSLFVTAALAYVMSRRDFYGGKTLTMIFIFTMYFGGGLVPFYMIIKALGLINNFWVFIIPGALSVYNMILIRSYIDTLPEDLFESARLDGASDLTIFFKIVVPLSKPILMTVALFVAVGQWNSWFDAYLYTSSQSLKPMQAILVEILNQYATGDASKAAVKNATAAQAVTPDSIRMAATIVSSVPIIMVYPFVQKYFVKGMMLGAVKA